MHLDDISLSQVIISPNYDTSSRKIAMKLHYDLFLFFFFLTLSVVRFVVYVVCIVVLCCSLQFVLPFFNRF